MNSGLITALAAICGSLFGAFSSAVSTSIVQRHQDRRDLFGKKIVRREALYSDFIAESARLLVDGLQHNVGDPQKLIPVYALLSRIRLSSSSRVLRKAEEVIKTILRAYEQPDLTPEQIQLRAMNGEDPLRQVQRHLPRRARFAAMPAVMDRALLAYAQDLTYSLVRDSPCPVVSV